MTRSNALIGNSQEWLEEMKEYVLLTAETTVRITNFVLTAEKGFVYDLEIRTLQERKEEREKEEEKEEEKEIESK